MPSPSAASSALPTPGGRRAGTSRSPPHTIAAAQADATVTASIVFARSTDRCRGRCAANTVVASVTPSRDTVADTIAVTVTNASVPRPAGPSSRVIGTSAANSPALPATCAQNSGADPRATDGARAGGSPPVAGNGDQFLEHVRRAPVQRAQPFAVGGEPRSPVVVAIAERGERPAERVRVA